MLQHLWKRIWSTTAFSCNFSPVSLTNRKSIRVMPTGETFTGPIPNRLEYLRVKDENDVLWAIYKTCFGCKHCKPGIVYGCDIQKNIDLSGQCNQKEEIFETTKVLIQHVISAVLDAEIKTGDKDQILDQLYTCFDSLSF